MLESEKAVSSSSSLELDPLLKDLNEKKLSFRRNVVSLAAELKDVRNRLASQEESFIQETQSRQLAEAKARNLEEEIVTLQKCLNERDYRLKASSSTSEQGRIRVYDGGGRKGQQHRWSFVSLVGRQLGGHGGWSSQVIDAEICEVVSIMQLSHDCQIA